MDMSDGELAPIKKEKDCVFHESIDNDIKTKIVKEEPRETYFIKCEICNENSDNETECVHLKNDRLDDKLQVPSLSSADGLHNNSSKEHVIPKVENSNSSSIRKEDDFIMKLINAEVPVKEEEYVDSPEYLSTNMDFVECETGDVKTEGDDIFCENVKIESVKNEPNDKASNEDGQPGSSKESQKDFGSTGADERKQTALQCNVCSKSFNRVSTLKRHHRIHTGEKPFVCKICSNCFNDSSTLRKHLMIHLRKKKYSCSVCPKTFNRVGLLTVHKKSHGVKELYNCEACSKSFQYSSSLKRHSAIHTGERRHACQFCSNSFFQRGELVSHEKTHTGDKRFKCKVCSQSCITRASLAIHERVHTGEKPFDCKVCSKPFSNRSILVKHERSHNGEKPFQCQVCSKFFSEKSYLRKHERIHLRQIVI